MSPCDHFTGENGTIGDRGPKGDMGDMGPKGYNGTTGAEGMKGNKGEMGVKGEKGEIGMNGTKGDVGGTGPPGEKGTSGGLQVSQTIFQTFWLLVSNRPSVQYQVEDQDVMLPCKQQCKRQPIERAKGKGIICQYM